MKKLLIFAMFLPLMAQVPVAGPGLAGGGGGGGGGGGVTGLSVDGDGTVKASVGLTWASCSTPTYNAGGTTTMNFATSNCALITTATGNTTLAFTGNHGAGPYAFCWIQDATGSRVPTFPATMIGFAPPDPRASVYTCYSGLMKGTDLVAEAPATSPNGTDKGIFTTAGSTTPTCASGNFQLYVDTNNTWKICNNATQLGDIVGTSGTQTLTNKSISGAQIDSGTVAAARLGSSPTATKLLQGDNTWWDNPWTTATTSGSSIDVAGNKTLNMVNGYIKVFQFINASPCTVVSASPLACGFSPAGSSLMPAGATSLTINTTIITANSTFILTPDRTVCARLGGTCNTGIFNFQVAARVVGTSFTVEVPVAPVTNGAGFTWRIEEFN